MTPAEKQRKLVDELSILPDAFECLNVLVSRSAKLQPIPESERCDECLVEGCTAPLWITSRESEGAPDRLSFRGFSEAPMVAALADLYCRLFSDCRAAEIIEFEPTVLEELGLTRAITPNRQHGARKIVEKIQAYARRAP